jgi:hypothetical protein
MDWRAASDKRRLMKPGPAISIACTQRRTSARALSNSTSDCASTRGLAFSGFASCIAAVIARSP